jgi:glycolate oxidase iron-sulfur subunit
LTLHISAVAATMHHAGQYKAMREMRANNVTAWRKADSPIIAVFCASCHHSLTGYGPESFADETEAEAWKKSLMPVSALLADAAAVPTGNAPGKYGYHQPCHWSADRDMPFLSKAVPGLGKGKGLCCGMGGILKMTDPDLSASMAKTCLSHFSGDITTILTGCSGCAMQLSAFSSPDVRVRHWLDVVEPF